MHVNVEIVDLDTPQTESLSLAFQAESPNDWSVHRSNDASSLLQRLRNQSSYHLVVLPEMLLDRSVDGQTWIEHVHRASPEAAVVIVAPRGDVALAAKVIEAGANDLLVLGEHLQERIATLLGKLIGLFQVMERNRLLREQNARLQEVVHAREAIVGTSPQVRSLLDQIQRVASVPRPVLIMGERGTGKELVARAIHDAGASSDVPMVTVNCAAFSDSLLESELFGHEKGAFTGAESVRQGKFEQADGGTLFLDEIGNMSLAFQEKILRVVEYGTFSRVGGSVELSTRARIIAATNRDLLQRIKVGAFLADLYDRIAFETIRVPALRQREGDVEVLARYFLEQFAAEIPAFEGKQLSESALTVLRGYGFPGNVRELKNLIERAAFRDTTNEITADDLGLAASIVPIVGDGSFSERVDGFAKGLIEEALQTARGNQAQAARNLGLSYHQFRYYAQKYELR